MSTTDRFPANSVVSWRDQFGSLHVGTVTGWYGPYSLEVETRTPRGTLTVSVTTAAIEAERNRFASGRAVAS